MAVDPERQEGGRHYKGMGSHEPWEVLRSWLTPEEYRGYMKGSMIVYLAREAKKGGDTDLKKVAHYAAKLVEVIEQRRTVQHPCVFVGGCPQPTQCIVAERCLNAKA
jgi:hypothetical protein